MAYPVNLSFKFIFWFRLQAQMPDPKTYKQHFENKHTKLPLPAELKEVAA